MGGHIACAGELRNAHGVVMGKTDGRETSWMPYTCDKRVILKWIVNKQDESTWDAFTWLRIGTSDGLFEHGDEPSGYIQCKKLME